MKLFAKINLLTFVVISLNAGEIQYGKGTFDIKGGFIGLDKTISADLQTYSHIKPNLIIN